MIRFQSLTRKNTAYVIDKYRPSNVIYDIISDYIQEYETCGDSLTQHSNMYHSSRINTLDFLKSLAFFVKNNPSVFEEEDFSFWPVDSLVNKKRIAFLMSLSYTENKRVYYHLKENKTSKSESKYYDKRWEAVPNWADKTPQSVIRLLNIGHKNTLEKIKTVLLVEQMFFEEYDCVYFPLSVLASQIGDAQDTEIAREIRRLFIILDQFFSGIRNKKEGFDCINLYFENR